MVMLPNAKKTMVIQASRWVAPSGQPLVVAMTIDGENHAEEANEGQPLFEPLGLAEFGHALVLSAFTVPFALRHSEARVAPQTGRSGTERYKRQGAPSGGPLSLLRVGAKQP